jgi:AcrR family transcriptional regulator
LRPGGSPILRRRDRAAQRSAGSPAAIAFGGVEEIAIEPNTPVADPTTERTRPLRADALRNRAALLAAARVVFQRDGLAAQIDDIAAEAGLGVGTLYRHFPTKEALIELMVRERVTVLLESARAALATADPWEGLESFVWRLATFEAEDRAIADVLVEAQQRDVPRQFDNELLEIVRALVARARATGQLRADVSGEDVLMAVCMIGKVMDLGADDDGERWRRLVGVILQGLRATPQG